MDRLLYKVIYVIIFEYMNFILSNKKFIKITLVLTAVFFLWINAFGLLYHMDAMKMEGMREGCVFSAQAEVCPMSLGDHINLWQSMFAGLPQNAKMLCLFILSAILFVIFTFSIKYLSQLSEHVFYRYRLYARQHPKNNLYRIETTHWLSLLKIAHL